MTMENNTAPTALAMPSFHPNILAVMIMANTFMAGPEYKKAIAGPAKMGNTVQEQTAKMVPDTDATA